MNEKLYIIGDIHGEYKTLLYLITERYKMENCRIIVAGDIGLGFYKLNYYVDMFNMMNKELQEKNVHLYFVRGNHDKPDWFNNTPEQLASYSHIHIVKDYTVLDLCNHHILCIGGAVSPDKLERTLGSTWWEGEEVKKVDDLKQVIKENNIDIVVSHTNPCFVEPKLEQRPTISVDDFRVMKEDAKYLAKVFFYLIENNNPLKYWVHGHHHKHTETYIPNEFTEGDKQFMLAGLLIKIGTFKEGLIKIIGLDKIRNKIDILNIS